MLCPAAGTGRRPASSRCRCRRPNSRRRRSNGKADWLARDAHVQGCGVSRSQSERRAAIALCGARVLVPTSRLSTRSWVVRSEGVTRFRAPDPVGREYPLLAGCVNSPTDREWPHPLHCRSSIRWVERRKRSISIDRLSHPAPHPSIRTDASISPHSCDHEGRIRRGCRDGAVDGQPRVPLCLTAYPGRPPSAPPPARSTPAAC